MAGKQPIDLQKFLSDPEFAPDRDLMNGVIDARLKHHADEAAKRRDAEESDLGFFDRLFMPRK